MESSKIGTTISTNFPSLSTHHKNQRDRIIFQPSRTNIRSRFQRWKASSLGHNVSKGSRKNTTVTWDKVWLLRQGCKKVEESFGEWKWWVFFGTKERSFGWDWGACSLILAEILFFRCRLLQPLSILCWVFVGANLYGCLPATLYSSSINC